MSGLGRDTEWRWEIWSRDQSEPLTSSIRHYDSHKEALDAGKTRIQYLRSSKPKR